MERWILAAFIVFFALQYAVETALLVVNLRHVRRSGGVPTPLAGSVDVATAERSRAYTLANGRFALLQGAFGAALTLAVLLSGLLPWLDRALAARGVEGSHRFAAFLAILAAGAALVAVALRVPRGGPALHAVALPHGDRAAVQPVRAAPRRSAARAARLPRRDGRVRAPGPVRDGRLAPLRPFERLLHRHLPSADRALRHARRPDGGGGGGERARPRDRPLPRAARAAPARRLGRDAARHPARPVLARPLAAPARRVRL